MKIKTLAFFTILSLVAFAGCNDKEKISKDAVVAPQKTITTKKEQITQTKLAKEDNQKQSNTLIPTFDLAVVNGKPIKVIADFEKGWRFDGIKNKIVLLDFFGTWCPPCKAEIPHLNNIRSKIEKDFEIIGIDIGPRGGGITTKEVIDEFVKQFDIKYPVSIGGDNIKLYSALRELNTKGSIPFMVLLNKKGEYVTHYVGMVPEEMIQGDIDKLLGK
jgi:thiol-disulfide isomerase/thioredoxin